MLKIYNGLSLVNYFVQVYRKLTCDFCLFDSYASVQVVLKNEGMDAFKPESYRESIIIERRITESSSSLVLKDNQGCHLFLLKCCEWIIVQVILIINRYPKSVILIIIPCINQFPKIAFIISQIRMNAMICWTRLVWLTFSCRNYVRSTLEPKGLVVLALAVSLFS